MNYILEYEDYDDINNDIKELNLFFINENFSYNEILNFLQEDCGFTDEELEIYLSLNEGIWDKLKAGAANLKDKAVNLKDKAVNLKDKAANTINKVKDVGGRVKDHIYRNKGKYILGGAALASGVGIPAAAMALGLGHLADRHS